MIGAFYQPAAVVVDLDCLNTLPGRELSSGLAEVIKYGIILDGEFFNWLEQNLDALLALDGTALAWCIRRCCELKAEVVAADEHEHGLRALLNLGHTYGHAIEAHMGYGNWLHGEAVAAGMVMAARTAERLGQFSPQDTDRIIALLRRAGLPVEGPQSMAAEDYLPHMMRDKKCRLASCGWSFRWRSAELKCAKVLRMIWFWHRFGIAKSLNTFLSPVSRLRLTYAPFTGLRRYCRSMGGG